MGQFTYSESVSVARSPGTLYDLISDITRMGDWSPICKACWWDGADEPTVGAKFFGRNEVPGRTWETECHVEVADPAREFAFIVGPSFVRWGYSFAPTAGGTVLTESWEFLPAGLDFFRKTYGEKAEGYIEDRVEAAHTGIPVTLAAIKATAEASPDD